MIYPKLQSYIEQIDTNSISEERKTVLQALIEYSKTAEPLRLNFICTHNSRRSQFAQVWAMVAAHYFGLDLESYSGGVEVTACNQRTVEALERAGFSVSGDRNLPNPHYQIAFGDGLPSIKAFSKLYDDPVNPKSDFAAVMTCSDADENCPFIPGTKARIALNYKDPKAFDDTDLEGSAYDERCLQIATEMFYLFQSLKNG